MLAGYIVTMNGEPTFWDAGDGSLGGTLQYARPSYGASATIFRSRGIAKRRMKKSQAWDVEHEMVGHFTYGIVRVMEEV